MIVFIYKLILVVRIVNMEVVVSIIKYLNYMNRFIGEIFYTTCRNDPYFLKKEIVKLIAIPRIYSLCTGCIFSNSRGYPNLGYELGRRCPGIDPIGCCINMRYKQYNI